MNLLRNISFLVVININMVLANPSSPDVVSGQVDVIAQNEKSLNITASDNAIINWDSFSINVDEITRFIQPSSSSAVLNRVTQNVTTEIFGRLEGNGHIYLINPNGIVIGKDAIIDTNSFTCSTLDIKDEDFLKKQDLLFESTSKNSIINYGTIKAMGGDVTLLAYNIKNEGEIRADKGSVNLGAGNEILLKLSGEDRILIKASEEKVESEDIGIDNLGFIKTVEAELKADGNPYKYAIRHSGKIESFGIEEKEGKVFLITENGNTKVTGEIVAKNYDGTGGQVRVLGERIGFFEEAKIDVSAEKNGGEVLIGGDYQGKNPDILNSKMTFVDEGVSIDASSLVDGDGGKVILWSDDATFFYGNINATGGDEKGDGGFVEVSGGYLDFNGNVDTSAINGSTGMLLLDPNNLHIENVASQDYLHSYVDPFEVYRPVTAFPATANINPSIIISQLALTNVKIMIPEYSLAGGNGDITVLSDIIYNSSNILEFQAYRFLYILASIKNDGTGNINIQNSLSSGSVSIGNGDTLAGEIITNGDVNINPDKSVTSVFSFYMTGGDNATATASIQGENVNIYMPKGFNYLNGGGAPGSYVSIQANSNMELDFGDLEIIGGSGNGSYSEIIASGNIDMTIHDHSTTYITKIHGGAGDNSHAQIKAAALLNINSNLSSWEIFGGISSGAFALVSSSPVIVGGHYNIDELNIRGGTTATADATMEGNGLNDELNITTDLNIQSQQAPASLKNIATTVVGGNINIDNILPNAVVATIEGDQSFTMTANSINLNGGAAAGSDAIIKLTPATGTITLIGDVNLNASGLGLAQITGTTDLTLNVDGDLSLINSGLGEVSIKAIGDSIIGVEGALSLSSSAGGDTLISADNLSLYVIQAAPGISANASLVNSGSGEVSITATEDSIIDIDGNLDLKSSNIGNTSIAAADLSMDIGGYVFFLNTGDGNVAINVGAAFDIDVGSSLGMYTTGSGNSQISSTSISLDIDGGLSLDSTLAGKSLIKSTGNSSINVQDDIILTGGTAPSSIRSDDGFLSITTMNSVILNRNSNIEVLNPNPNNSLDIFAGKNIVLQGTASSSPYIKNNSLNGEMSLVVDNLYPTYPEIGSGAFLLDATSAVNTNGGALRIYTGHRSQDVIEGTLNGVTYTPDSHMFDTDQEQWGTYYSSTFGGSPFTIFYKAGGSHVVEGKNTTQFAIDEAMRYLAPYDAYISRYILFTNNYKDGSSRELRGGDIYISSFDIDGKTSYFIRERKDEGNAYQIPMAL